MRVKIRLSSGETKTVEVEPWSTVGELLDRVQERDLLVGHPPKSLVHAFGRHARLSATSVRSNDLLTATKGTQISSDHATASGATSHHLGGASHARAQGPVTKRAKPTEVIVIDDDEREVHDDDLTKSSVDEPKSDSVRPLFYQNPIPGIGVPESERYCTCSLSSIILGDHLEEALILNYCVDLENVVKPSLPQLRKVPVTLCMSENFGVTHENFRECFPEVGSRLIFPKCPPYGTHHTKLFVLFYGSRGVRVIVQTSNLETSNLFMQTEAWWFQDFPAKGKQDGAHNSASASDFGPYLGDVLVASGITEAKNLLARYDFSGAEAALVATFPRATAYTSPGEIAKSGLGRVIHLLEKERRSNPEWAARIRDWSVVLQGSSLGSQTSKVGSNWILYEIGPAMGARRPSQTELVCATRQEMLDTHYGEDGALSTFFSRQHFENPQIKSILRTWTPSNPELPSRALVLPHYKSYFSYEPKEGRELAWIMIGSHNCTKAAWGSWTSASKNKFTCLSYELSVMFLPSLLRGAGSKRWSIKLNKFVDVPLRTTFVCTRKNIKPHEAWVPVPFALPTNRYDFTKQVPYTRD